MVNIVVLGSGLIPRGKGIAPRKIPFEADLKLIKTIILTDGLQVYIVNPETNAKIRVGLQNYEKVYKASEAKQAELIGKKTIKTTVSSAFEKVVAKAEEPKQEVKVEQKVEPVVEVKEETANEEKKDEQALVPVNNPNNNYSNNNKHKK